jgi:formate dehydrogenase alpha subunit
MAHTESSENNTASLTIDGKQVTVPTGTTILEAASELGIHIPTLCWLKKVSTTGACRICVVEIEGVDRPMTACNTPVKDGINVTTVSPKLEQTRRKTMELMLVNHPLDCPVCDAAGECDLQDTCYSLKVDRNEYDAVLEPLPIRYDWPLIENCTTRCILCEKCVKVCHETVGADAIEVKSYGDRSLIDTADGKPLDCDFCGNCINVCPTGTLISKPFKFHGRPWEFDVTSGICGFCSSGCQIEYHAKAGRIGRVTSSDESFNRGNLCINGRFGYSAFNSPARLTEPLIKGADGIQQKTEWDQALGVTASKLKEIIAAHGPGAVAGIGSPRVTNEENYLFQKFLRGTIGTNNIDSEARLGYLPSQVIQYEMLGYSGGTFPMDAIEHATSVLVIGADLKAESAGFAYRVIQAATKNNAKLVLANSRVSSMNKFANIFLQYRPGSEAWLSAGLNKAMLAEGLESKTLAGSIKEMDPLKASLDAISFESIAEICGIGEAELRQAARLATTGGRTAVIYGSEVIRSAESKNGVAAVVNLAILTGAVTDTGAGIYPLDEKNNTQGMLDMGVCPEYLPGYHTYEHAASSFSTAWKSAVPTVPGKDLFHILAGIENGEIKALYVMGSDIVHILPERNRVIKALQKLELLVVQDMFLTDTASIATVVLPAASVAEKTGSFTSVDNRVQCFPQAIAPIAGVRSDFIILSELQSLMSGTAAPCSLTALQHEICTLSGLYSEVCDHDGCRMGRVKQRNGTAACFKTLNPSPVAITEPGYAFCLQTGPVLRHNGSYSTRSESNLSVSGGAYLEISETDATRVGIVSGDNVRITSSIASIILKVKLSDRLQPGLLFVPNHFRDAQVNLLTKCAAGTVAVKLEKC